MTVWTALKVVSLWFSTNEDYDALEISTEFYIVQSFVCPSFIIIYSRNLDIPVGRSVEQSSQSYINQSHAISWFTLEIWRNRRGLPGTFFGLACLLRTAESLGPTHFKARNLQLIADVEFYAKKVTAETNLKWWLRCQGNKDLFKKFLSSIAFDTLQTMHIAWLLRKWIRG